MFFLTVHIGFLYREQKIVFDICVAGFATQSADELALEMFSCVHLLLNMWTVFVSYQ